MKSLIPKNIKMMTGKQGKGVRTFGVGSKAWGVAGTLLLVGGGAIVWDLSTGDGGVADKFIRPQTDKIGLTSSVTDSNAIISGAQGVTVDTSAFAINDNIGDAVTLTINPYDVEADTPSEITTSIQLIDPTTGSILTNQLSSSDFTAGLNVGDVVEIHSDNATYYLDNSGQLALDSVRKVVDQFSTPKVQAHTVVTETNLATVGQDKDKNTLTASTATVGVVNADYDLTLGNNEEKIVHVDFTQGQANALFRLGAVCTTMSTNTTDSINVINAEVDTQDLVGTVSFKSVGTPKELNKAALSVNSTDSATVTSWTGYDDCFVPTNEKGYIDLHEYDNVNLKATIKADGNPVAGGAAYAGFLFVDYAEDFDTNNRLVADFFRHDVDEEVTDIGLAESHTSPQGGTSGVVFELV